MADNPMFKKKLPKIPKWAYYISAGAVLTGVLVYMRQRQTAGPDVGTDSPGDGTDDALAGVDGGVVSQMPGSVVVQQPAGEAVSGELNTDIPTATLGAITDLFGTYSGEISSVLAQNQQAQAAYLQSLAEAGTIPASHANTTGVVTAAKPKAKPKAKPNPCAHLPKGYHCGGTIRDGNLSKSISGGKGWVRIKSGGSGKSHWIQYHVRTCKGLQLWQVKPNAKGKPWKKLWSGARGNIC